MKTVSERCRELNVSSVVFNGFTIRCLDCKKSFKCFRVKELYCGCCRDKFFWRSAERKHDE